MQLVSAIAPVLLISALGYILSRYRFLHHEGEQNLNSLVFSILIPALLFNGILKAELVGFNYLAFLAAYFIPLIILFVTLWLVSGRMKLAAEARSVLAMSAVYGNVTVIGIPVSLHFLGDQALLPLSIIISVHNFILFSLATVAAETKGMSVTKVAVQIKNVALSLFKNPITMSLFSGLLLNMLGFQLPVVVANALGLLSEAAVPLAFLVLGATLSHFSLRGELLYSLSISAIKLLVFPFAIWFSAAKIWHIDGLWLYTAVMLAATPVGVSTQVMARRYHCSESLVASTIIISTVLSLFTLPLAMHWLQAG